MVSYSVLADGIIKGDVNTVESEVNKAINEGVEAQDILTNGLIAGMEVVGKHFKAGEMFLPEVILSGEVLHRGLSILKPLLAKTRQKRMGKVVMGTVEGDIHDIGKRIVILLLEGNGFEVIDLGVNVNADVFARAIEEHKPDVLGMSALLTTTMLYMGKTIDLLQERKLREGLKVMVGGASVNEQFARSIGADGYAPEAGSAVEWVKKELKSS